MKLLILQIGDIHLKTDSNIDVLIDNLIRSVEAHYNGHKKILTICGDIAFSGNKEEYKKLESIINKINKKIKLENKIILTPGNHDCNYKQDDSIARERLIKQLINDDYASVEEVIPFCIKAQSEYWEFSEKYDKYEKDNSCGLIHEKTIKIDDKEICIINVNSAWMSRLEEVEGSIYIPVENNTDYKSDLTISIMHHPYQWFNANNKHKIKGVLEKNADIIITGHEHIGAKSLNYNLENKYTEYIAGQIFNNDSDLSGFNAIEIDFENNKHRISEYKYKDDIYLPVNETEWFDFKRNLSLTKKHFEITDSFYENLISIGANFAHHIKENLSLDDIYIYPNLRKISKVDTSKPKRQIISAEDILGKILANNNIIIGAEKSGKSSLCKKIYLELFHNNKLPIYIKGEKVNKTKLSDFEKLILDCFKEQYDYTELEYFIQLPESEIVLIIDDFSSSKINPKYRQVLINNICSKYKNLLITVDDVFPIEELFSAEDKSKSCYSEFDRYEILDFGHNLRFSLIKKWFILGQEETIDDRDLFKKNDMAKNIIDTIIGKNYVPSRPIYILTILQSIEAGQPHELKESGYGHYYQYLITKALSNMIKKHDEVDAFYNYLSELSYYMYKNKTKEITEEEFIEFHEWFCKEGYSISQAFTSLIYFENAKKIMCDSSILINLSGVYSFKYSYIYYYFVGRYLSENIEQDDIKKEINRLLTMLYVKEYANIIIFLTHHTKSGFIINGILEYARSIFNENETIKLDSDIESINKLIKDIPKRVLHEKNIDQTRAEVLEIKDDIDNEEETDVDIKELPDSPPENIDFFTKLTIGFKYIEIIGQILKNYHGSLRTKFKYDLALEAIDIGLRSLSSVFNQMTDDLDNVVNEIKSFIRDSEKELSDEEISVKSKQFLFGMCHFITIGFIRKISESLGHEKLSEIFKNILSNYQYNSYKLVDVSIKLDFYKAIPFKEIQALSNEYNGFTLPMVTLQSLVLNHLYMYPTSEQDKQKICSYIHISIKDQREIDAISVEKKIM